MKHLIQRILGAVALTVGALGAPAAFAGDVGVSISVGQPGFYGRIDVGNVRPDVVYAQVERRRRGTTAPGLAIAATTGPVAGRCTSCRRAGTPAPMRRPTTVARTCIRCRCTHRPRRAGIRRAAIIGTVVATGTTIETTAAAGKAVAGTSAATTIGAVTEAAGTAAANVVTGVETGATGATTATVTAVIATDRRAARPRV